jgi:hypothetical protein
MPNWTSNIIRVEGPEAAMREFLNHFKGDDEPFDFNRIIPMPAILRHTGSGARTFDGRTHRSWYIIDPDLPFGDPAYDANERPFTPEEKAALADIGHENWYDWSVANWGTKWNAVRAAIEELPGEDGAPEIRFDTAWSAPFPVYHKIAALFRQLAFEFSWTDEDQDHITHSMRIRIGEPAEQGRGS